MICGLFCSLSLSISFFRFAAVFITSTHVNILHMLLIADNVQIVTTVSIVVADAVRREKGKSMHTEL